jgi:DtxR family transcriptional regulator, Mn-dependent transcriptional regulator
MHTFTEENYLKAIYKLSESTAEEVTTNSIAERLSTKASTVTDMLKKLAEKKLVNYQKYQGVSLTEAGRKVAVNIIRKHRLWECFLVDKLQFRWDEIHSIAEDLEHINSQELIDRLEKFLNFPRFDPHGDPIPDINGTFHYQKSQLLSDTATLRPVIMTGVIDHSPAFLQYLDKIDMKLGYVIEVTELFDFDKSLNILVNNASTIHISAEVAKNVLVSVKQKM